MSTYAILNIVFIALIVGGLAAVCYGAHLVAGGHFELRKPELIVEEEERLAA